MRENHCHQESFLKNGIEEKSDEMQTARLTTELVEEMISATSEEWADGVLAANFTATS